MRRKFNSFIRLVCYKKQAENCLSRKTRLTRPRLCAFVRKKSEDKKGPFVGRCIAKRNSYQSSINSLGSFILFPFWETVLPLMRLSDLCCARIVTLRQRHSHGKARIRANIFIQQFMTKNYTLVYTLANLVLHRLHKCDREYMASDYRWLTLHVVGSVRPFFS